VEPSVPNKPSYEALEAENAALRRQVTELTAKLEMALAEIERLKRSGKRQATPFSQGTRKSEPQRPGRKPGEGPFRFRAAPAPEQVSGPPVVVPVTASACPHCGGELEAAGAETVWVTDLPPQPQPVTRAYQIALCQCRNCGSKIRGEHPEVAPDQRGATAHRLGLRGLALAHLLHYGLGLPVRRVPSVLKLLTGLPVTQGALTQDALRRAAGKVGEAYRALRAGVAQAAAVHTDDTGWRVGGENAWLMAFETGDASVYQVRRRHRNEEVREVIPADYPGVLCSDRGKSYDAQALDAVRQQKCLAHLQRNLAEVLERKQGRGRWWAGKLKRLLGAALAVWHRYRVGEWADDLEGWVRVRAVLVRQVDEHLRDRRVRDPDNQRLLDEVGWHHDRGNLLRFLFKPDTVEPTNNRAERALRGAVIARKVSQCSKNEQGAEAFGAFTSVIRTVLRRCPDDPVGALIEVFRTGTLPVATR